MERSGPDDARDDAWDEQNAREARDARGDGQDDALRFGGRGFEMFDDLDDLEDDPHAYPVAPLPRHERTWRHPSEMGEAAWVRTEPPVAIGRGLLVTSGAIGSALGVAVLYLMLPTGAGTPSAGPAATSSFAAERTAAVVTLADAGTTSSFVSEPTPSIGWTDSPGLTLPSPDTPSTVLVMTDPERDSEPVSVAVSIEGSPYMVTTANALSSLDAAGGGVHLLGPGGPDEVSPLGAELLSIEGDLAFLSPASGAGRIEVVSFADIATAEPGQPVTVLADEPEVVPYASGDAVPELDPGLIVEGTPVVDADGALVALCTVVIDADGAYVDMVPLTPAPDGADGSEEPTDTSEPEAPTPATSIDPTPPDASTPTTPTTAPPGTPASPGTPSDPTTGTVSGAWIGLRFDGAPTAAPLTVTGVVAGSPALAAGVMVGERLVAIDGVAVATVDDVIAAVKRRLPGDVVRLTLAPRSTSTASGSPTSTASGATGATTPAGQTGQTAQTTPTTSSVSTPGTTTTTTPSTTTTVATGSPASGTPSAPTSPATPAAPATQAAPATPATSASNGAASGTAGTRTVSVVLGALAPTV